MPHEFNPHAFLLDTWHTDVRGSDFALLTSGPRAEALDNPVLNAAEVSAQRHMVHCSTLALALDNEDLAAALAPGSSGGGGLSDGGGSGAGGSSPGSPPAMRSSTPSSPPATRSSTPGPAGGGCEVRLAAAPWPPPQADPLLADLDADVMRHLTPEACAQRPCFAWLAAVPDEADAEALGANLRGYLTQQLEHASSALPALAGTLAAFAGGEAPAAMHPALRHPAWPSDHQLTYELAATHAAAAAGSSPPFAGDAPGGPLQLEAGLAAVAERYAAARGCSTDAVQLAVLGTRLHRERRQHILVMCTAGDGGLAHVFGRPLPALAQYNLAQREGGGEVVCQPDSDGRGLTWWVQSTVAAVPPEEELTQPWKTWVNLDPASKGAEALSVAAHSLGNARYDSLEVALYFPGPAGGELRLPVARARLRRADALRPCRTGSVPRSDSARLPAADTVAALAAAGVPLLAAPELVQHLREGGQDELLQALEAVGAIRRASPRGRSPAAALGAA